MEVNIPRNAKQPATKRRNLNSPQYRAIRNFIVEKRKTSGLSQQAVAARLGVSQGSIARIEAGRWTVYVDELLELAEVLGFDPDELFRELAKVKR